MDTLGSGKHYQGFPKLGSGLLVPGPHEVLAVRILKYWASYGRFQKSGP